MVTPLRRVLRKLRILCNQGNGRAVAVVAGPARIVLFDGWDDSAGRLRVMLYRAPRVRLDDARNAASLALGPDAGAAIEFVEHTEWPWSNVWYAIPLDGELPAHFRAPQFREPAAVREFTWKFLAATIGQYENGLFRYRNRTGISYVPAEN